VEAPPSAPGDGRPGLPGQSRRAAGLVSSLRLTKRNRAWRVHGRDARVSLEGDPAGRGEIQDVDGLCGRPGHSRLNPRIAEGDVFADEIVGARRSGDVDAVGIARDRVFLDDITAGETLDADPKVVRRFRISISVRFV
jgi:hypothetical protein